jgi:hypothetical protein
MALKWSIHLPLLLRLCFLLLLFLQKFNSRCLLCCCCCWLIKKTLWEFSVGKLQSLEITQKFRSPPVSQLSSLYHFTLETKHTHTNLNLELITKVPNAYRYCLMMREINILAWHVQYITHSDFFYTIKWKALLRLQWRRRKWKSFLFRHKEGKKILFLRSFLALHNFLLFLTSFFSRFFEVFLSLRSFFYIS